MPLLSLSPALSLIVGILATWRLTSIIYREEIAQPVRKLIGIRKFNDDDPPEYWIYPQNFIGKLFSCFWCVSVWAGIAVLLVFLLPFHVYILLPLSFSAGAIIIERIFDHE